MKFNKKSLSKVAILSAVLGLSGMCFGNVVNAKFEIKDPEEECIICLETIGSHDSVKAPCGHVFGKQCIGEWFKSKSDHGCPVCKRPIGINDLQPWKQNIPAKSDNPEVLVCPVCFGTNENTKMITLLCCRQQMCSKCIEEWDSKNGNGCPLCRSSGTMIVKDKNGKEKKISRRSAWQESVREATEYQKNIAEKEGNEVGSLTDYLDRFKGDATSLAREQEAYVDKKLAELASKENQELADYLLSNNEVDKVEKMFDDLDSYQLAKKMTVEDQCVNNSCCVEKSYQNQQFDPGNYAPAGNNQIEIMVDGQLVTID
jgi:hypothetical protein